jgi:bifunctional UDP-N-acetylglucosamine pyrophosphorylase / glucosamine-1-phosphate N-acetyltransferase
MRRAAVILAAGQGTRMRSSVPKVLHAVGGRPMLDWSIALARTLGCDPVVVVGGTHNPSVLERSRALGCAGAVQDPPLGTGHAVSAAREALAGFEGDVIVLYADTPFISEGSVLALFAALDAGATVAVLGFEPGEPGAYGRLIEDPDGGLTAIVEAREASPEQLAVRLCNAGVMAARAPALWDLLSRVTNANAKGEYYLTDIVGLARADGGSARAIRAPVDEVAGVNSKVELAEAEAAFQARMRTAAMEAGVTLNAPETVFFSWDTALAADVHVEPHVVFAPRVTVETGARIRAFCHLEDCVVRQGAILGPYARIRPGSDIGEDAHIGNFVETKKAKIGKGAKANHLAYLGDVTVGAKANIGAGTITCNYDGFDKHATEIGDGAFVGSDTMLVAPVKIGKGAYTGSGSTITKDVPDDALSVERSDQKIIPGWAARFRDRKRAPKGSK